VRLPDDIDVKVDKLKREANAAEEKIAAELAQKRKRASEKRRKAFVRAREQQIKRGDADPADADDQLAEKRPPLGRQLAADSQSQQQTKIVQRVEKRVQYKTKHHFVHWVTEVPCSRSGPRRWHRPVELTLESMTTFKSGLCLFPKRSVGPVVLPSTAIVKGYGDRKLRHRLKEAQDKIRRNSKGTAVAAKVQKRKGSDLSK